MFSFNRDHLGDVYVKHCEPIYLHEYLQKNAPNREPFHSHTFESIALGLTNKLMEKQQGETPVTLNSLLSACLLQETRKSIMMSELLEKSGTIYDYLLTKRWIKTHMTLRPKQVLVEKHIKGLGFATKKKGKDLEILLDPIESDWRCKLILAYYSMNLMPAFLLEGAICTLIKSAVSSGEYHLDKPVEIAPLMKVVRLYADLFKNETMQTYEVQSDIIMTRVGYWVDRKVLEVSPDNETIAIKDQARAVELFNFFSQLILPLIDTYLITLMTLEQLCGKNLVIKQKTLIKELHVGIKYMYKQGSIPMLHSCLKQTIKTALERYQSMGLLEITAYLTKKGNSTVFLRC